jgi:hypothetical protein
VGASMEWVTEVGDCGRRWVSVWVWVSENWVCGGIEYVTPCGRLTLGYRLKHTPPRYFYGYVVL